MSQAKMIVPSFSVSAEPLMVIGHLLMLILYMGTATVLWLVLVLMAMWLPEWYLDVWMVMNFLSLLLKMWCAIHFILQIIEIFSAPTHEPVPSRQKCSYSWQLCYPQEYSSLWSHWSKGYDLAKKKCYWIDSYYRMHFTLFATLLTWSKSNWREP